MAKQITGVLVTTEGEVKKATIEDSLDGYYKALNCDIIDCTVRRIGSKEYDIVCDDEGLLKAEPMVTAVTKNLQFALVGNLFICHHDDDGNWTSLTDEEVEEIKANTMFLFNKGALREVIIVWA